MIFGNDPRFFTPISHATIMGDFYVREGANIGPHVHGWGIGMDCMESY